MTEPVAVVTVPASKRCPICRLTKPESEWQRSTKSKDGLYQRCRACNGAIVKAWRKQNRGRLAAQQRTYRANRSQADEAARVQAAVEAALAVYRQNGGKP